jgi:hypothetical protein
MPRSEGRDIGVGGSPKDRQLQSGGWKENKIFAQRRKDRKKRRKEKRIGALLAVSRTGVFLRRDWRAVDAHL